MPALPTKLSTRHRKFVESYVVSLNCTKAALDAGYSANGAHTSGYRLLQKAIVKEMIAAKLNECTITKERTLREIGYLAYSRPADLYDDQGNLKPIKELPEHVQATIASVEVIKRNLVSGDGELDEVHKVKQWDKTKALEMAGKYLKLFDDKSQDTNVTIQVSWQQAPGQISEPINVTPERKAIKSE